MTRYVGNLHSGKLDGGYDLRVLGITRLSKLDPRWDRKCVYSGAATDTETPRVWVRY